MGSHFDAASTWAPSHHHRHSEHGWADAWLRLTNWWLEPAMATASRAGREAAEALLTELVEGISRRFVSHRFSATLRTTPVSGVLESLRLVREDQIEARIDLRDVSLDGLAIDRLQLQVPSLALQITPDVRLTTGPITAQVHLGVAELLRWLQPRLPDTWSPRWKAGEMWATSARGRQVMVEPTVRGAVVELEVRAIRILGLKVRIPRWFRPKRQFEPELPYGARLVGAGRSGDDVDGTIELPPLDERLDLAHLRDALAGRRPVTLGSIGLSHAEQ